MGRNKHKLKTNIYFKKIWKKRFTKNYGKTFKRNAMNG